MDNFAAQVERSAQSEEEIRKFLTDFALVRLKHIANLLLEPDPQSTIGPTSEAGTDWQDPEALAESGVLPEWMEGLADPGARYLHVRTALDGSWTLVRKYLDLAGLSKKQGRGIFKILRFARRPATATREQVAEEVRHLNSILHQAAGFGLTWNLFSRFQSHLEIHGAWQNLIGNIGSAGASIAFLDALEELGCQPTGIAGTPFGPARSPLQVYERLKPNLADGANERPRQNVGVRAILLPTQRAVVFGSDPDIAILRPMGRDFASAQEAVREWERARRIFVQTGENDEYKVYAVGEVKTATDPQNLHERLALGSRDTASRLGTRRFLMMAVLTPEILGSGDRSGAAETSRRTNRNSLQNRDVTRFTDVFNLYFAWGYDGAREAHSEQWDDFKNRVATWCGA